MTTFSRRTFGALALSTTTALGLAACGGSANEAAKTADGASDAGATSGSTSASTSGTIEVTDFQGTVSVPSPATRIGATDNRIFRTLEAWGVKLVVAPQDLMPASLAYKTDSSILNTGSHREPNLEQFVAADPDLVLNGQRYQQHYDAIKELLPNAAIVDTSIDTENKRIDDELRRQVTLLGDVLQHQDEAKALIAELDKAIERVKAAYTTEDTVMGLITSGGDINYAAPVHGRAVGPLFPVLGLTPALETEGTTDHQGDDVSVETVAHANPDWIIVMDRDAAVASDEAGYQPASELIEKSEALKNVTAVTEGNVVYMPNDFYLTEDIQAYTEFLNTFAKALEAKKG